MTPPDNVCDECGHHLRAPRKRPKACCELAEDLLEAWWSEHGESWQREQDRLPLDDDYDIDG